MFVGAMAEGESFVLAGGALSQRGLFPAWEVALAAFGGSIAMDQVCFALGRWCREWRWVSAMREKAAVRAALGFIEKYPNGYVIGFRYLYGLRIVSPLAIGLTRIGALRFTVLNMVSAAVWAVAFTALGVLAGNAVEKMFGRVQSGLVLLFIILVLAGVSGAIVHHVVAKRTKKEAARAGT